ncbi:MAG: tetratricopeptide repeat protein [Bacteroidetes bacterium]|nr:tetratricopeptide repeat protein [Bacteroidota bacterium]
MSDRYKNIVYPGASVTAGGNVHIGDVIYNFHDDFHHSILFLRIERAGAAENAFTAQLSVKSKHAGQGKLGTSGEPLLKEKITLDLPPHLFQQVEEFQQTRRSSEAHLRDISSFAAQAHRAEDQLSQALFSTFFSSDIGTVCRDFIALLEKGKVEELLLAISADDEKVKNLPWEMVIPLLFPATGGVAKRSLAVSSFGIVRTLEAHFESFDLQGKTGSAAPLKMLFVTALPENLSERDKMLEIEDEQQELLIKAVGNLEATGAQPKIVVEFLDNASLAEIEKALAARHHDILHISGHGAYRMGQGTLHMENEWGDLQCISGAELGETIRYHKCVKLLLLSACETAVCGEGSVVEQLATGAGTPAIVAMRFSVTDEAAKRFTAALYETLAKGKTLTHALAQAREALWKDIQAKREGNASSTAIAEWFTPSVWLNQYVGELVDARQPYALPDNFYPRSSFFKIGQKRLVGQGFIGRKRYLIRLRRLFASDKHACLHGLGGMGKTTLAEAFAHNFDNRSHEVVIFRGSHQINEKAILDELFARFCEAKPADSLHRHLKAFLENPDADPTQKLQALLDNHLKWRKIILLFDNFEDVQDLEAAPSEIPNPTPTASRGEIKSPGLRAFLLHLCENAPPGCHLLFTTRYKISDLDGVAEHLALDKMSYAEQYRLTNFSEHLRRIPMPQRDGVCRRLDGHPRAYEFLESLLKKDQSFDWSALDASVGQVETQVFEDLLLEKVWQRLTAEEQAVFKVASIFIARTEPAALAAVSGKAEAELLPVLQALHEWSVCFVEEGGSFEVHRLTSKFILERKCITDNVFKWHLKAGVHFEENNSFPDLGNHLRARWHYLQGKDYVKYAKITLGISGVLELKVFDFRASRDLLLEVLKYEDVLSQESLGEVYHALAEASMFFGMFEKTVEYSEKVLRIGEILNKGELKFLAMNTIGLLSINQGLFKEALKSMKTAMEEVQKTHFEGDKLKKKVAYTKHNIGVCYQNLGKLDKALNYYYQSFKDKEDIADYEGMGISFNQIGNIFLLKEDYEEALTNYHQSLIIKHQLQNKRGAAATYMQLGVTYTKIGNFEEAEHYYVEALEFFRESGNIYNIILALTNIGHLKYELQQFEEAAAITLQANYLEQMHNFPRLKKQIDANLAGIAGQLDKVKFDELSYSIYETMLKSNG